MKKKITMLLMTFILLFGAYSVLAQTTVPEAPSTFTEEGSSRRDSGLLPDRSIEAIAGNITALNMHGNTVTRTWFGVYGNVTGTLVLSNGENDVMYDWSVANPRGQVYATRAPELSETILWNQVDCYNYTITDLANYYTISELNADLGINPTLDQDAVNRTFRYAVPDPVEPLIQPPVAHYHNGFFVGTKEILENTCPATSLYSSGANQNWDRYQQVLLYNAGVTGNSSLIYTSIIEDGEVTGFDGTDMDFQMLLGENGHDGDTDTTTYYFYVELE
ncbi:MAG: hypothetical protein ACLFN8_00700 [Candidatus Woesearchaeota archaeon]